MNLYSSFWRELRSPFLVFICMLLLSLKGFAQIPATREEIVFTVVENQPEFPGGLIALTNYLQQNVKYPPEAQKAGIKGRVYVSFIVEKDGSLTDIQLMKGLGYGCNEEAIRVVNAMPKWQPGTQSGRPVRVRYNLPIEFPYTGQPDCSLFIEKQPEFPGGQKALIS